MRRSARTLYRARTAALAATAVITGLAGAAAWALGPATPVAGASTSSPTDIGYGNLAFGSNLNATLAGFVKASSGRSALTTLGCAVKPGLSAKNSTVRVTIPKLGTIGAVATRANTYKYGDKAKDQSAAQIGTVSLLGGIITATAVQSSASASIMENGKSPHASASSKLVGLSIEGHSVPLHVSPNTTISLPGIGEVVLNQQSIGSKHGVAAYATVRALFVHITVSNNPTGLPVGAELTLARSSSSVSAPEVGKLGGVSQGTALLKSAVISGPTFPQPLGCFGTGGKTNTNAGANASVGTISATAIDDTARGVDTPGQPLQAQTASTVAGLKLGFLLSATAIKAVANSTTSNGKTTLNEDGSEILGLQVAGVTVPSGPLPPENTAINIPLVGTLYLNRVVSTGRTEEVRMIDLVISNTSLAALIGAPELYIARAVAKS